MTPSPLTRALDPVRLGLVFGALLLAVAAGAAVATADVLAGDDGPYLLLGAVLAGCVALAVLWRWRLGVFLLAASLPFEGVVNLGATASGVKAVALLTFFSLGVALLFEGGLWPRAVALAGQPLVLFALGFVLWSVASVVWAVDGGTALSRAATFLGLFGLMFCVGLLEGRRLVQMWVVVAVSAALSVPAAYVLPGGGSVRDRFSAGGMDPNDYACLLVVVFLVAFFGLEGRYRRVGYALAPFVLFGILSSQSRTGLLALAAVPILAMALPQLWGRLAGRTVFVYGAAAAVFAGIFLAVPGMADGLSERYMTLEEVGSEDTWAGRWSLWQGAFRIIADNPVLGVGAGNFAEVASSYSAQAAHLASVREGAGVAHNTFLSVFAELGIVGFVLFAGALALAVVSALRLAERRGPALGLGLVLGLGAFVVAGMTLSWEYQKIGFLLYGSVLALGLWPSSDGAPDGAAEPTDAAPASWGVNAP